MRMEEEKEKLLVGKNVNLVSSFNEDKRRMKKLEERLEEAEEDIRRIKEALEMGKALQKEEIPSELDLKFTKQRIRR